MPAPDNTLPMMTGTGPFGPIEMGGMFTVVKIREGLARDDYRDPGPYKHPQGSHSLPSPSPPFVGLIRIPRRASASRRSISISALTLLRSATAHRFTASRIAFSVRSGNGMRSGPGGRPRWAMTGHE